MRDLTNAGMLVGAADLVSSVTFVDLERHRVRAGDWGGQWARMFVALGQSSKGCGGRRTGMNPFYSHIITYTVLLLLCSISVLHILIYLAVPSNQFIYIFDASSLSGNYNQHRHGIGFPAIIRVHVDNELLQNTIQ
jgi:hypothetical protein